MKEIESFSVTSNHSVIKKLSYTFDRTKAMSCRISHSNKNDQYDDLLGSGSIYSEGSIHSEDNIEVI